MAGDSGPNALSLLPENVQVQYLQKIALRAENPSGHNYCLIWTNKYFLRKQFFAAIEAAHFPAVGAAIDACAAAIFTYFYIPILFAKWHCKNNP